MDNISKNEFELDSNKIQIKENLLKYFSFWPYFILSIILFLIVNFIFLRYAENKYISYAKIQIIDKSQDSEMALPTAMTIFNRSMVNLENEIGVLKSYSLHKKTVSSLKSNVKYITVGRLKTSQNHPDLWFNNYNIDYKINTDTISERSLYTLNISKNNLNIDHYDYNDNLVKSYAFDNTSTFNSEHNLPFDIKFKIDEDGEFNKMIEFLPFDETISFYIMNINTVETGIDSDQLDLSIKYSNRVISDEYLNTLISEFDRDGIVDRQMEYKRTMDFVDSRAGFLITELKEIEMRKQNFKEENKLTDIESNATINITQQYTYDNELFNAKSQKDLTSLLRKTLLNSDDYGLMPANIGIENPSINDLISQYNLLISERDKYLFNAGPNNTFLKNLERQIIEFSKNIFLSIDNYLNTLNIKISNIREKEKEFEIVYNSIPENEKILRSIERELEVKEALFLLLLQKKEEAAINYAVVKPSIKVIDYARSSKIPVFPNILISTILAVFLGLFVPFIILYLRFSYDTKIHTKDQLQVRLNNNLPIVGEIPHIHDQLDKIEAPNSRNPLSESIRMLIANLNFILFNNNEENVKNNLILVTSSIKGEGKTIVSVSIASALSVKYNKVLLVGADLRNPQIHKFLGVEKNIKGLSDYIYKDNLNWRDNIIKHNKLDIFLSGTIPPNPTEMLSSKRFQSFIDEVKASYDYIIIDSAPCLLVSDTFEISKHVDTTLYVVRSNFSEAKLTDFINECNEANKLSNINLVLNGVGNSSAYGYKYGYQYGYQYGYKYGYNYGYGYGYLEDKLD